MQKKKYDYPKNVLMTFKKSSQTGQSNLVLLWGFLLALPLLASYELERNALEN